MKKTARCLTAILACIMVLTILFVLPMVANATEAEVTTVASGTCGASGSNVTWSLDSTGHFVISGTGAMKNYNQTSMPWYNYLSDIKTAIVESGVTSIGNRAFSKCTNLTEITIPDTVTSIGNYAFFQCSSLPEITIPDQVTSIGTAAFYECRSLTAITIPDGVTSIGSSAFNKCTSLTEIIIPESVETIGATAFSGCTKLTEVIILSDTVAIDSTANTIPTTATICGYADSTAATYATPNGNGFASIGSCGAEGDNLLWYLTPGGKLVIFGTGAMEDYYSHSIPWYSVKGSIKSVVIKDGVTSIGKHAFHNCSAIQTVSISDSVTLIDDYAFYNCDDSQLTSVNIPNGVTTIGLRAFFECDYLTEITIPSSVTSIGAGAVSACKRLTTITLASGNTAYHIAGNCLIETATGTIVAGFNTSTIPADGSVIAIGDDAFSGCTGLVAITIPDSVTSIGKSAFNKCTGLSEITISENVQTIGASAFSGCTVLSKITILSKTVVIGEGETTFPAGATIYGYADSTAYTYATTYDRTFVAFKVEGNIDWAFDQNTGTLTISGEGDMADYTPEAPAPWNIYADSIRKAVVEGGVSSIGAYTFDGCNNLSEVIILSENTTIYGDENTLPTSAIVYGYSTNIGAQNYAGQYERTFIEIDTCGAEGDNLLWYFTEEGALVIFGTGDMENYTDGTRAPWYSMAAVIENVVIEDGVDTIGDRAFSDCSNLTKITIPASVTSIGYGVVANCKNLTTITVAADNAVYCTEGNCLIEKDTKTLVLGCKASVIPADGSVTAIGAAAFEGCTGLTEITIPASVTSIGQDAFKGCSDLVDVIILSGTVALGNADTFPASATIYGFAGSTAQAYATTYARTFKVVNLCGADGDNLLWYLSPDGELVVFGTGEMANYSVDAPAPWNADAASIKKVTVEDSVTSIGNYAFVNCTNLIKVVIPNSVTSIGDGAFSYCYKLTSVAIPEGVTEIGAYAFYYCVRLAGIEIPASVTEIGHGVVANCKNLTTIAVKEGNPVYTSVGNCLIEGTTLVAGCNSSVIPATVTAIGDSAFSGCSLLTVLNIPESVTSIGSLAFQDCTRLTEIEIPANVTEIGEGILAGCDGLTTITVAAGNSTYYVEDKCLIKRAETNTLVAGVQGSVIPEDVTAIGRGAFLGCRTLTEIIIPDNVTSIDHAAFFVCSNLEDIRIYANTAAIFDYGWTFPEGAILYGYEDSSTQAFADKYDRAFVVIPSYGTPVYTAAEFANAVTNGGKVVVMKDIYLGEAYMVNGEWEPTTLTITKALTISGADNTENKAFTVYRGIPFDDEYTMTTETPAFLINMSSATTTITIENVIFDGQKAALENGKTVGITVPSTTATAAKAGCFQLTKGTLLIEDGAVIQNFNAGFGAAIYIASNGNVVMNGGKIQDNACTFNGAHQYGGGVVYNYYGDFVMTDGIITRNTSTHGGTAVYVNTGHFWMYGGSITENLGGVNAGAIKLRDAYFYMYGGTISGNRTDNLGYGHAILVNSKNKYPYIVLAGGTIQDNGGQTGGSAVYVGSAESHLYIGEPSEVYVADGAANFADVGVPAKRGISADLIGEWEKQPLVLETVLGNPVTYYSGATAAEHTYLVDDLMEGSRLVFEDDGTQTPFMTLAEGYTPDGTTLAAICLRDADSLYNPIVSNDRTLVWPDANTTYRVVKSAALNDGIDFDLYVAFRNSNEAQTVTATRAAFGSELAEPLVVTPKKGYATCVVIPMAPKQMTDMVTLMVNDVKVDDYTLAGYLGELTEYAKERNDQKLGDLVSALLDYGSAAQVHFNYDSDDALKEEVEVKWKEVVHSIEKEAEFEGDGTIFDSAVVNVSSKVSVCVVVELPNTSFSIKEDVKVTLDKKERSFTVKYDDANKYVAICILDISAAELMKDIVITFGESELTYSVPVYVKNMQDDITALDTLKALVKALYVYADTAAAYAGN